MPAYSGTYLRRLRQHIWNTHPHTCHLCGQPITRIEDMELDHLVPRSRGGTNTPDNLRPAHGTRTPQRCNNRRSDDTITDYQARAPIDRRNLYIQTP